MLPFILPFAQNFTGSTKNAHKYYALTERHQPPFDLKPLWIIDVKSSTLLTIKHCP